MNRRNFFKGIVAAVISAPLAAKSFQSLERFYLSNGVEADAKKLARMCGVEHMPTPVWQQAQGVVLVAKSRFSRLCVRRQFVYYDELAAAIKKDIRMTALHGVRVVSLYGPVEEPTRWVFIVRSVFHVQPEPTPTKRHYALMAKIAARMKCV